MRSAFDALRLAFPLKFYPSHFSTESVNAVALLLPGMMPKPLEIT